MSLSLSSLTQVKGKRAREEPFTCKLRRNCIRVLQFVIRCYSRRLRTLATNATTMRAIMRQYADNVAGNVTELNDGAQIKVTHRQIVSRPVVFTSTLSPQIKGYIDRYLSNTSDVLKG